MSKASTILNKRNHFFLPDNFLISVFGHFFIFDENLSGVSRLFGL